LWLSGLGLGRWGAVAPESFEEGHFDMG
jgi:hypothetical protein